MNPETLPAAMGGSCLRPRFVIAFAVVLATATTAWLHFVDGASAGTGADAAPALLRWLRDSSAILPLALAAVVVGGRMAALFTRRADLAPTSAGGLGTLGMTVALTAGVFIGLGSPLLDGSFQGLTPATMGLHMLRDGVVALCANVAAAAFVVGIGGHRAWAPAPSAVRASRAFAARGPRALVLQMAALAIVTLVAAFASTGGEIDAATNQLAATDVCPGGAPLKTFDVTAIDIDITLNRFGDHDPAGKMYVLSANVAAARAEAQKPVTSRVSIGLHGNDIIQPLVVRANQGDCVQIALTNSASGGTYGVHIDGVAFQVSSSGDAVGKNPQSAVAAGGTTTYRYYIPNEATLEGAHYLHPGAGNRAAVNHGLFGALVVEPPGSRYLDPNVPPGAAEKPLISGWEAVIVPGAGKAFREDAKLFHDIGNESEKIFDKDNNGLPTVDPHTQSYRPGSRGINYRSEPFMDRLNFAPDQKSVVYGSYTFGDPATPTPLGYQGDPTKFRVLHASSEVFHVYHLHGGGIRWRFNPKADLSYDYADTGLNKHPKVELSESLRLDSQSLGPGESYDLEIEGGAGGVQQGAGEFLYHCHIAEHYFSGMWAFWRVFDTLQPDLAPLPDRAETPAAVDSAGLVGRTINGTTITAENLDSWIRPQIPAQGKQLSMQDASVMNWTIDSATGIYVNEPEDTSSWPYLPRVIPGHPGFLAVDSSVPGGNANRPKILFNPSNGRPAFPLLRTHVGARPPFSGNGHSGAPYLGEVGDQPATSSVDPWAGRKDGICPAGAPIRRNSIVGITLPIQNTAKGVVDPLGALFVLAQDKDAVYAGTKPRDPLALRANIGDCIFNTLVSELKDGGNEVPFSKSNIHIHHVQFDTQASDGVISGFSYEQSVRPYKIEDVQLSQAANAGDTVIRVTSVTKFQPGVDIAVGEGLASIEVNRIVSIDAANLALVLAKPLIAAHAPAEWAGTEFVQYIWYPDVELDNIFFHDHVNGIFGWSHGMVGQLVVEPRGSTYHDPVTGEEVASGAIVDIRTNNPLVPGQVDKSFREVCLWTIDNHTTVGSSLNLRAEPWADRGGDPSLRFSSYTWGDPFTPLIRAYAGDPVVIRTINVSQGMQTLHVDGHRTFAEPRYMDALNKPQESPKDTIHYGISEKFTLVLQGGAGGPNKTPGDYLYNDGVERSFKAGAWGIIRVLAGQVASLQPLPGTNVPATGGTLPAVTGGRPPSAPGPGNVCPPNAPSHSFQVTAVDLPSSSWGGGQDGRKAAFVLSSQVQAATRGKLPVEPLVLHVAEGECVNVTLTNARNGPRVSFHASALLHDINSSGINIGFNPEETIGPGQTRVYSYYADTEKLESVPVSDFGGDQGSKDGLYGAIVVAPRGATFTDPLTGARTDAGAQVDVHVAGTPGYRDFTLVLADQDPIIGQSTMPYPRDVAGPALVNYRTVGQRTQDANTFSSLTNGDPVTPILQAYAGDPMRVHVLNAQGSEQLHTVSLGGLSWNLDANIDHSDELSTRALGPQEKLDAHIIGGAGGRQHAVGDFIYQDRRLPFTEAGMWGLIRVLSDTSCPIKALDGLTCGNGAPPPPPPPSVTSFSPASGAVNDGVSITGAGFSGATGVTFNGTPASFTFHSDTLITTFVPAAATTGKIAVTGPNGTGASTATFTVTAPAPIPVISGFSPVSGPAGTAVALSGTGFAGATKVTFSGLTALFTVTSDTLVNATVPAGATSGVIALTTAGGTAQTTTSFTVTAPPPAALPSITSFTPTSGNSGTSVFITGAGFTGVTSVQFNGTPARAFTVVSSTQITAIVGTGTASGFVRVSSANGTAVSTVTFKIKGKAN